MLSNAPCYLIASICKIVCEVAHETGWLLGERSVSMYNDDGAYDTMAACNVLYMELLLRGMKHDYVAVHPHGASSCCECESCELCVGVAAPKTSSSVACRRPSG